MSDWWSRALSGEPAPRSATPPVAPPAPVPFNPAAMPGHRAPVAYDAQRDQVVSKAQHTRNSNSCPECGSGNYMRVSGNYYRCYDCGYPVQQSTSGLSGATDRTGPSQPAQQIPSGGGFQPSTIIGHVE